MSDVPCKRYASRHSRSARLLRDGAPNHVRDAIARGRLEYEETVGAVRLHKSQANLNVELRSSAESTCPLRRSRSDSDVNKRSSSPSRLQFQLEVERRVRGELEREKEALFRTNLDLSGEVERTRGICDDLRFKLELAKNRNPSTECDATKHFLSQTSSTIELPRLFPLHEEIPPMNAIDKVEWWRNKDDDNRTTTTKRDSGCQMSERSAVTLPPVASRRLLLRASSSTLNKASSCSPSPPPLPLPPPPPPSSSPPHAAPLALHPAPSSPSPARVVTTKAKTKRDGGGTRPVSAAASASPSSSSSSSLPRRTDGRIGEEETALADGELIDVVVDRVLRRLGSSGGGDPGSGSGGRRLSTLADAAVQAQTGFTTPAPRTPELAVVRARPKRFSRGKPGRPSPRDHIYRKLDVGSDDETTTTMAAVVVGSPSANAPRLLEYVQQCNVIAAQLNRESRQILAALERGTEGL